MPRVASLRPDRPGLPKPLDSLIRNRWTIWPGTAGRFQPERPDDLSRNEWTLSSGMGGRFHRNTHLQVGATIQWNCMAHIDFPENHRRHISRRPPNSLRLMISGLTLVDQAIMMLVSNPQSGDSNNNGMIELIFATLRTSILQILQIVVFAGKADVD